MIYNTIKSLLKKLLKSYFATKRLKELCDLALRVVSGNSFQQLTLLYLNCTQRHLLTEKHLVVATDFACVYSVYIAFVFVLLLYAYVIVVSYNAFVAIVLHIIIIIIYCRRVYILIW